jgi:carbonic anhydrase/acetyltransferase-like protein (isoleucine patch superfamily)
MTPEPSAEDTRPSGPPAPDFGGVFRLRGYLRRRLGLLLVRAGHPKVSFGPRCDVRSGAHFTVARAATVIIGSGCVLDHGFTLEATGRLTVGDRTVFGHHCTVAADDRVAIGRECLIGELVSIRDHDHAFDRADLPILDQGRRSAPVVIGDDVWIGAKATITAGVTIGDGAVVGAHAVVTHDLPAGCIAVGVPARVVKRRASSAPATDAGG